MSLFETLRTANHNLFRNKVRTLLTIIAIFVGSFTIILNVAINTGVNAFIDDQVNAVGGENYLIITKGDLSSQMASLTRANEIREYSEAQTLTTMDDSDIDVLNKLDGIVDGSVSVRSLGEVVDYILADGSDKKYAASMAGAMPPGNFNVAMTAGVIPDADAQEDVIALEAGYAQALGYDKDEDIIGETVILGVQDPITKQFHEFKAKVVGVQASGIVAFDGGIVTNQLQEKLGQVYSKYYTEEQKSAYVMVQATYDTDQYTENEIKKIVRDAGYTAMTISDIIGTIKTFFDVIMIVFTIFGSIALLAAAIGIVNTLLMSVEERTREIGLDKALGMSSGRVFMEFATEAILLGFWGSVFGVAIAMMIGTTVNQVVHAPGGFLEVFPTFELFKFSVGNVLPIVITVMLIALIAGTTPALKAARKNPIEALRYE